MNIQEHQRKQYVNSTVWKEENYIVRRTFKIIEKLEKKTRIIKVLDIGCTDGSFSKVLMDRFGYDCYGIDICEEAIKKSNDFGVKSLVHDLSKGIPFEDEKFDLVIAGEIIEHIYDTNFLLEETNRVLKKGGVLIVTTPNTVSLWNRIRVVFGKQPAFLEHRVTDNSAGHIRAYTLNLLTEQMKEYGFEIIKKCGSSFPFPMNWNVPKSIKNIAFNLGKISPKISCNIIVVGKKIRNKQ